MNGAASGNKDMVNFLVSKAQYKYSLIKKNSSGQTAIALSSSDEVAKIIQDRINALPDL